MIKYALYMATVMAMAPGLALAQAADPNHPNPGDGYRIPVVNRTNQQSLAAYQTNPGSPGDGYRIAVVPRTSQQPLAAYPISPGVPGDGYRMR